MVGASVPSASWNVGANSWATVSATVAAMATHSTGRQRGEATPSGKSSTVKVVASSSWTGQYNVAKAAHSRTSVELSPEPAASSATAAVNAPMPVSHMTVRKIQPIGACGRRSATTAPTTPAITVGSITHCHPAGSE